MQFSNSLFSAVSLAFLISSVSSSPIQRSDDVTCSYVTAAFLTLQTELYTPGETGGSDYTFVGLSAPDGSNSRFLTTKRADGKVVNSDFAFYNCSSKFMGYETVEGSGDGAFGENTKTFYGHIAPYTDNHNPKHCLTKGTDPTDPTVVLDEYCSFSDDDSQSSNFFSYIENYTNAAVFLGGPKGSSNDYYITLSDDGTVHFNSGTAPEGTTQYYLGLPQFVD